MSNNQTLKRRRIEINASKNKDPEDHETKGQVEHSRFPDEESPEFEKYDITSQYYDLTRVPVGLDLLKAKVSPDKTDLVLDAGCGTGNYLVALAPYVREVVPFEYNGAMLRRCLDKIQKNGIYNQRSYRGSLLKRLPFRDDLFDMIMNNQVIHHLDTGDDPNFPNLYQVLNEFYRVLRPGGWLAINLTTRPQADSFWWQYLIPETKEIYRNKYAPSGLIWRYLRQIGFEKIEVNPVYEPLQGEHYYNLSGPLSENWRNGDSTWSLVSQDRIAEVERFIRQKIENGTMGKYFDKHDQMRRQIGQSVYIFAQK